MQIYIKIRKLKILKLKKLIKKVVRKLYKKIYYIYRSFKIKNNPIDIEKSFFYDFKPKYIFLLDSNLKEQIIKEQNKLSSFDEIIKSANEICSHEFSLLGSGSMYLGEKLPWNEDFKTGFRWSNKFYKSIKTINLSNNADVKVPWELSRFQHIFTLGKAYWITKDEKYSLEFKSEFKDWIKNNPVEMSVNWTCTMDVAIRAVNLICGYFFFQESNSIDYKFWIEFHKLLYLHGKFIFNNLENEGEYNGNHYLSNLAGLIWIGIYFGDFIIEDKEKKNNPKYWLEFGLLELENEMKKEVNADGTNYEGSTAYHKLVTEIFLITTILCNKNYINFSKEYMLKLEKMCEFIMDITKPNGLCPLVGDSDDGRFIISSNYCSWNRRDFGTVLAIAGEYFNRDDFRVIGKSNNEEAIWIMGNLKLTNQKILLKSKAYFNGGYYILRNDRVFCLIRCGELACRGKGGHSHNDQLSFELNVDGEDFIIDPGTYLYTADYKMRNLFRSTKMHNTVYIQGYEQNDFKEYDLFNMREQTFANCKLFNELTFYGEHYGYKEKCGVIHNRKVNLINEGIIISDEIIGYEFSENIYINFIIDNSVEIEEKEKGIQLTKNNKRIILKFNEVYSIETSFVSYGYGQKIKANKLSIKMSSQKSSIIIKLL